MHLQVAEIPEIERFYTGVLGFDATVRTYPGALFVSAGGLSPPHRSEHLEQPRRQCTRAGQCRPS